MHNYVNQDSWLTAMTFSLGHGFSEGKDADEVTNEYVFNRETIGHLKQN